MYEMLEHSRSNWNLEMLVSNMGIHTCDDMGACTCDDMGVHTLYM